MNNGKKWEYTINIKRMMNKVTQRGIHQRDRERLLLEILAVMFQFILWSQLHHLFWGSVLFQSASQVLNHEFSLKTRMTDSSFYFGDYV